MLKKLTLTKPAIRMRRIWNFPIPISSTASDKVYVFSVVSEIKKKSKYSKIQDCQWLLKKL